MTGLSIFSRILFELRPRRSFAKFLAQHINVGFERGEW
jgi:hypothetical protein